MLISHKAKSCSHSLLNLIQGSMGGFLPAEARGTNSGWTRVDQPEVVICTDNDICVV